MQTQAVNALPEYRVEGDGEVTVFLFHGAYGDGRYFGDTAKILADNGYRVVVWNAPGYGNERVPENFSIDLAGDAAKELVRAEGTETNVLLGHSMGALVAPNAAMKLGDEVAGIVLSGASVGFKNRTAEDQQRFLEERLAPIERDGMTVAEYSPQLLKKMMAPGAKGEEVERVTQVVADMKTETFVAALTALTKYDNSPAINAIDKPTLLLAGEFDTACPPAGMEKLHSMIPNSELYVIKDAGHYAFAERPIVFHGLLLEYLDRKFRS